jgi:hypothetical protein
MAVPWGVLESRFVVSHWTESMLSNVFSSLGQKETMALTPLALCPFRGSVCQADYLSPFLRQNLRASAMASVTNISHS